MIFLGIYGAVNILALIITFVLAVDYDRDGEIFLIYPQLWKSLDRYEINLAGKVSAMTLISLVFAPAILVWLTLVGVAVGVCVLSALTFNLFCKIFRKRSK